MNENTVMIAVSSGLVQLEYCWMCNVCGVPVFNETQSADCSDICNVHEVDRAHCLE